MELEHIATHRGRLSDFLKGEMALSAGLINRLKRCSGIFVNGVAVWTNHAVGVGDRIAVKLDDPEPTYPAEDMALSIRFEDEHILVVDKPPGMLIHPSRQRNTGTLANGVLGYYKKTGQSSAFHPATRLDRDTFGLVLLAKNPHIHRLFNDLHGTGLVRKTYHALIFGAMPRETGFIDAPIARCPLPSLLRQVDPTGQPSRTGYRVLEQMADRSLLALEPLTGRTHQLRIHCAHLGCPILGDPQYGTEESQALSQALGFSHQQLCAKFLDFRHPVSEERMHLESALDVGR